MGKVEAMVLDNVARKRGVDGFRWEDDQEVAL